MALNRLSPNTTMSEWLLISRSSVSHQLMLGGGWLCAVCFSNLRNHSPVRAATSAFALAINSPDMSSTTVGKSHTSKPSCFNLPERGNINPVISQAAFQLLPALLLRCVADGCPEAFVTNASMKKHMARVHQKKKLCRVRRFWHFELIFFSLSLPF